MVGTAAGKLRGVARRQAGAGGKTLVVMRRTPVYPVWPRLFRVGGDCSKSPCETVAEPYNLRAQPGTEHL
jgi:hypothetical protein